MRVDTSEPYSMKRTALFVEKDDLVLFDDLVHQLLGSDFAHHGTNAS
jgi:hypothetical protein